MDFLSAPEISKHLKEMTGPREESGKQPAPGRETGACLLYKEARVVGAG